MGTNKNRESRREATNERAMKRVSKIRRRMIRSVEIIKCEDRRMIVISGTKREAKIRKVSSMTR